ncbi:MAG: leucyl/phenylalanyl-tRNA--protein transferase [Planctomycetota bacterium]
MARHARPILIAPGSPPVFPDPRRADAEGLLAIGGDLAPERLLAAYRAGIFPWYEDGVPPLWWSPDPRAAFTPRSLHVSRSLARTIRRGGFTLTWNRAFREVMEGCAADRSDGTWIIEEMVEAYCELHRLGHAHSLEVRIGDELVGGLYGVQVGALFAAESKFHRVGDMSKIAVIAAVRSLFRAGIGWFDVQMPTDHLESLGAFSLTRAEYLDHIAGLVDVAVDLGTLNPTLD